MILSNRRKRILILAVFCFFQAFYIAAAQHNLQPGTKEDPVSEWKVMGPGGGGGVFLPTVSPLDENLVLSHCDMTAAYLSSDGGKQWNMFNLWTVPVDFKFHPSQADVIYVATKGYRHAEERGSALSMLYRSVNRGKSWEILYPKVSNIVKNLDRLQSQDFLPSEIISGAENGSINKIAIDPAEPQKIYLGLSSLTTFSIGARSNKKGDSVIIVGSSDGGRQWRRIAKLPGKEIKQIFPKRKNKTGSGLLIFTDGFSFNINESTGNITRDTLPVTKITAVEGNGQTIYLQSPVTVAGNSISGGVYVSKNRGKDWQQVNNGLVVKGSEAPSIDRGFDVCESRPNVAYISVERKEPRPGQKDELIFAIYKTDDFGEHWQPVLLSSTPRGYITNNFQGAWMEKSFDPGWGGSPIDLGIAPSNPDICYASDEGRAYKTIDGGKTWHQVYSNTQPDGSATTNGLNVTTAYGVHFDPFDVQHYFICYTDIGLFDTYNGGKSWDHSRKGIPRDWENTCYQLAFDPAIKGKVWSVWANAHDLPREKMFSSYGFSGYKGGVALSTDAGKSWEKSNQGIPVNAVCTNILIDPDSQPGNRTLYVSVFDGGVYKSTDDGKTWILKNNGLGENLFAWQLRIAGSGRLFLLCSRGWRKDGTSISGSVYYSDDGADSWQQLVLPAGYTGPHDLLIDPINDSDMYISCWPQKVDGKDKFGGVLKSADKGITWTQVFDERVRVNSAAADPLNKGRIFVNTFQNAAFISENHGATWQRIGGYRFKWGQRVIPDISSPGNIFLTTYGGSVFYGPAKGIYTGKNEITNMPAEWW